MKPSKNKAASIFLLLFFLFRSASYSQSQQNEISKSEFDRVLYSHSHFSFTISPYIVNKAKAIPLSGSYHLNSIYMYGFEGGTDYHSRFSRTTSAIIGFHGGLAARNYKLFISKNDFTPNLQYDFIANGALTREYDFYICIPLLYEKRWFTKNNNYWDAFGGINVRFYPAPKENVVDQTEIYQDANGNQSVILELDYALGNNNIPWLNYNIGGGYTMLLSNNNFLCFNLVANFSNTKLVNGTYTINVDGKPESTGTYSANLSYVGLSFSYILTGANKRMRKFYESRLK
ncbi:MAG TPA: hypothetical protein VGP55_10925 [Chitinophagaceae bacterium]|nr:hypothetical protein [Chitinophagaceae bacterium]